MKTTFSRLLGSSALVAGLAVVGTLSGVAVRSASAATVVMAQDFNENDCSGFFGSGFDACQIFDGIEISPVIAKFDTTDPGSVLPATATDINNTKFPSVDGTEWTFSGVTTDSKTGTWTYNRGTDDPGIRYWAAKAGRDFKLFWVVDDSVVGGVGSTCDTSGSQTAYTLACLAEAQVVTTGTWTTPGNKALSHITFYDSEDPVDPPEEEEPRGVPEPSSLLGLGAVMAGTFAFRRRKSN